MSTDPSSNFFGEGSPYLSHPLLTPERTAYEIDEIADLVGSVTGRVVDIGCGFGRHSIELASRGADVTGIDPSSTMIDAARAKAAQAEQFVDFQCVSAAEFKDVARYDLALCLFTTLGQLDTATDQDDTHLELLGRAKRALRPGGKLVIEVPERTRAAEMLVASEQLGPTLATRRFDAATSVITEHFAADDGASFELIYRVFAKTELVDLLHDVGFVVQHVRDSGLAEPPKTLMTLVAERPA